VRLIDLAAAAADQQGEVAALAEWVLAQDPSSRPVVCAARRRSDVTTWHEDVEVAPLVERVLAGLARALVDDGRTTALIVAGGESSGAVVRGLGVRTLRIGPELTAGVCWSTADASGRSVALALKSGNFGADDLFVTAWERLA
jgi:uncharacterized protein YgbK (DUF1537 family)